MGSMGGTLLLYIFPPLFYLRVRYFTRQRYSIEENTTLWQQYTTCAVWKDVVAVTIVMLGVVLFIAGNYVAIEAVVNSRHHHPHQSCYVFTCNDTIINATAINNDTIINDTAIFYDLAGTVL